MKKYTVRVDEVTTSYLEIEADSREEVVDKVVDVIRDEPHQLNNIPDYEFTVSKHGEEKHRLVFTATKRDDIDSLITDILHAGYSTNDYYVEEF